MSLSCGSETSWGVRFLSCIMSSGMGIRIFLTTSPATFTSLLLLSVEGTPLKICEIFLCLRPVENNRYFYCVVFGKIGPLCRQPCIIFAVFSIEASAGISSRISTFCMSYSPLSSDVRGNVSFFSPTFPNRTANCLNGFLWGFLFLGKKRGYPL